MVRETMSNELLVPSGPRPFKTLGTRRDPLYRVPVPPEFQNLSTPKPAVFIGIPDKVRLRPGSCGATVSPLAHPACQAKGLRVPDVELV